MSPANDTLAKLADQLKALGFASTRPGQFMLQAGAIYWRISAEPTRLVPHRVVVCLGAPEVSDFVRRAFMRALNPSGTLAWFSEGESVLQRYEQRADLIPLLDSAAIEVHWSHDDDRQARYQAELFRTQIAPLAARVRSLESYGDVLAIDSEPFSWARDHAALRLAAICYVARRLNRSVPALPPFAERQFVADSAHQLIVESVEDYVQFLSKQPLEE